MIIIKMMMGRMMTVVGVVVMAGVTTVMMTMYISFREAMLVGAVVMTAAGQLRVIITTRTNKLAFCS